MLNPAQKNQIESQIEAYEKQDKIGRIKIPLARKEFELEIDPFVANPEIMNAGVRVVEYLSLKPEVVKGKIVTDMGTGSGMLGIASGLLGARKVFMPDIDGRAVTNARKNVETLKLSDICDVFQSDLFSNFGDRQKADVQIFNHPFFADSPVEGKEWTQMMLGGTELIGKYLEQSPRFSTEDAVYIFPWLTLAGNEGGLDNDPAKRASKYGFEIVNVIEQDLMGKGLQKGKCKIYELKFTRKIK